MKKIMAASVMILSLIISFQTSAAADLFDFVGTWSGDYCTMNSSEGLHCGRSAEIVIAEQKNNLVRGYIKIGGKEYPLSGIIGSGNRIDYTDSLGTIGVLGLTEEKNMQMKALNRCLAGGEQCAHSGIFKRKK